MKNKRLLLGDQAIALGAIHAGISRGDFGSVCLSGNSLY